MINPYSVQTLNMNFSTDPPSFITRPKSRPVIAGSNILLECQVRGDPHPDIVWSLDGAAIDPAKVKVVPGKGLRILNVHPSDEGTYACKAKNAAGSVSAKAVIRVTETPVISVKPESDLAAKPGETVKLDCISTGKPPPTVFWSKEGSDEAMYPGGSKVDQFGTLTLGPLSADDSGHYTCVSVNEVGSAIARSRLTVVGSKGEPDSRAEDDVRVSMMSTSTRLTSVKAAGSRSIKLSWRTSGTDFLEGFFIYYRPSSEKSFSRIRVSHAQLSTFVLGGLRPWTEYEVFVQPFYEDILGVASASKRVSTETEAPSEAPEIAEAEVINGTAIFLAWKKIPVGSWNGPMRGYEVCK